MNPKTLTTPPSGGLADGIEYSIRYSRRRTLALYVYPDQRVELRAPVGCPEAELQRFLAERLGWVRRKLVELAQRPARPVRRYEDGEGQAYLGRHYPLSLIHGRPHGVWLAGGRFSVRYAKPEQVPALLRAWYRQQALTVFSERLEALFEPMAPLGLPQPTLKVRFMRSRWGSCSRRAQITLNADLVKYPLELVDYVVVHELCHLREFNHGPRFYALMDRFLPDWRARKHSLQRLARDMPVD